MSIKIAIYGFIAIASCLPLALVSCNIPTPIPSPETTTVASTPPPLIEATLAGDLARVRSLLENGTDPNLVYHTNTALTYAARDGFTDIARLLIEHQANVNWIDGEGVTPLILAAFKDHPDLAQLLLDHGANPTLQDQWHRTALDYALARGEEDAIAQLLRNRTQNLPPSPLPHPESPK